MKGKNKKRTLVAVLSIFAVSAAGAALAGCDKIVGRIDAPERIEAELGTYVIPDYEVIDSDGMILAGYDVYLKSATDADGQPVDITYGSVTVEQAGLYTFVYSAGSKKVKDVSVIMDFADRTAPTINYNDDLPKFFIKGNSYKMPSYTLSGDYDRSKCYAKVYHIAEDKTETEVTVTSNRFKVIEDSGTYEIRIHVEDAVGNANDYVYARKVDGPENIVEDKVMYFDEEFGERQVSCYENSYTAEYVTKNEVEDNVGRFGENGALKVTFDGVTPTRYNEGVIIMDVPAVIDISKYSMLEMWVYNDSDADIVMGSQWWNDTSVKKGKWTRLTWSVRNWGGENGNKNAANTKEIGVVDITGTTIRFVFDYNHKVIPNGTFYLSSMRAIPSVPSTVTAGENVTLDITDAIVGDTIKCSAPEISGMEIDCFLVDGKPIVGDTFTVTETSHHVTVQYVKELTYGNMSWGTNFFYPVKDENWMTENKITAQFIGSSDKWVLSADILSAYFSGTGGQYGNFTVMIGDRESVEIQLHENGGTIKWYYEGGSSYNTPIATLSDETFNKLKSASPESPVNVQVMRNGDILMFFIDGEYIAKYEIKTVMTNNSFGFGYRKESDTQPAMAILGDVKAIIGEERVELYYARLDAEIKCSDGNVSVDKESYRIGDTVTLSHKEPENGQLFGYYTVDGIKIIGDSFVVTKTTHNVAAVYVSSVTVTFGDGVTADESDVLGLGFNLHLSHGEAPEAGKIFDHYLVDGTVKIYGNVFTISASSHNITAVWVDADDMTWGESDEKYDYVTIMGNDSAEWNNLGLEGEVFGSSEYWAITVDVKHTTEWNSFEFIQGSKQSIRIRFHQGNYFGVVLLDGGAETAPANTEFVHAYPHKNAEVVAKLLSGATVTCVRYGDKITLYADNVPFFTTDYAVDHTGDWFGLGYIADSTAATKPEMNNIKFIMGKDKVDAYIDANWADVTVNGTANVTFDKESYKQYDTVILTAKDAEEGKKFAYFTLNGEKIEGNKYVLNENITYNFDAVYTDVSKLELANGIKTEDESTEYAIGIEVKLIFDGEIPADKFFECFTVDGEPIIGDTFVTSGSKHVIGVIFSSSKIMLGNGIKTADGQTLYARGETVTLKYEGDVPANKFFDCFKVDGKALVGDTFITTADNHVVEVVFASSKDDMTWGSIDTYETTGSDAKTLKLGTGTHWVLKYQPEFDETGWVYTAAFVGGTDQLFGIEMHSDNDSRKLSGYGGAWKGDVAIPVTEEVRDMLRASKTTPVTMIYVRTGDTLTVYLSQNEKVLLLGKVLYTVFQITGNDFGLGERSGDIKNAAFKNVEFVVGADKTNAYLKTFEVTLNKTKVTTDKDTYSLGDTVILTADPSTDGLLFAYFEVDDKRIDGNSFVTTKLSHKVVAVYNEVSTVTLGDGITAVGQTAQNGKITVGREVSVKLEFNGNLPAGMVFDCFKVDGIKIDGDSFETKNATHSVEAVLVSTASEMTWTKPVFKQPEGTNEVKVTKLGNAEHWTLSYTLTNLNTTDNIFHFGAYVGGAVHLAAFEFASWGQVFTQYGHLFAAPDNLELMISLSDEVKTMIQSASGQNPITVTYVRQGKDLKVYLNNSEKSILAITTSLEKFMANENYTDAFGYGWRSDAGSNPTIDNIRFITGEGKVGLYLKSLKTEIAYTKAAATENKSYYIGDTVSLTHDAAELGYGFSHYEVDGTEIDGDSFVVTKLNHTVKAIYVNVEDTYRIAVDKLEGVVKISGGQLTLPQAAIKDGNGETVAGYTISVSVTDVAGNPYEVVDGKVQIAYKGAIDLTITYTCGDFDEVSSTVTLQRNDNNYVYDPTEESVLRINANGNTVAFDSTVKHGSDIGSVKVSAIASNETGIFLPKYSIADSRFIEFYAYTEDDGVQMGGWWCNDTPLRANAWTKVIIDKLSLNYDAHGDNIVLRLMGSSQGKTVWISSVKAYSENEFTQLNDLSVNATAPSDGTQIEWTTERVYAGNDSMVVDNGSMKITCIENNNYIVANMNYIKNLSAYSGVYFYVYLDEDKTTSAQAGAWWCGDTPIEAGKWTKVELDFATMNPLNVDNTSIKDTELKSFVFRILGAQAGEVFYITSLYGIPKNNPDVVSNRSTDYSLVNGGDGELAAIINDNFFPDAE